MCEPPTPSNRCRIAPSAALGRLGLLRSFLSSALVLPLGRFRASSTPSLFLDGPLASGCRLLCRLPFFWLLPGFRSRELGSTSPCPSLCSRGTVGRACARGLAWCVCE